jgi:hypothetical protein
MWCPGPSSSLGWSVVGMVAINDPGQPELSLRWRSARARRPHPTQPLHVSDYGLPAIIDVDVLDADILVSAVAKAAKGLHLRRIGPQQSSGGGCKRHHVTLSASAAPKSRQDRHSRHVRTGHLNCKSPFDFIPRCRGLD